MFGRHSKIFRGFLRVDIRVIFALGVALGHGLRGGGSVGFGLPGFDHVFFRQLLDLCRASAETVALFVEL